MRTNFANEFWNRLQNLIDRETGDLAPRVAVTRLLAPEATESDAARDISALAKLSLRGRPLALLTQPIHSQRPNCIVMTVSSSVFPDFGELFEQYLDKNPMLAEVFMRLKPHMDVPYILVVSSEGYQLYAMEQEHILRQGSKLGAIEEDFFALIESATPLETAWAHIPRKSISQSAEEMGRWVDLWKAAIGSHSNTSPAVLQTILQKVILLVQADFAFGAGHEDNELRSVFFAVSPSLISGESDGDTAELFDGVAWIHERMVSLRDTLQSDFLRWNAEENSFFTLMSGATRRLFSHFLMEFFLLSEMKLSWQVLAETFGDANSRLKMWKHSVTDTTKISRELQADEINVYEPMRIDVDDCGTTWAVHLVRRILDFWRDRCLNFEKELNERQSIKLQFDMFQRPDQRPPHVPSENDVFDLTFGSSVRLSFSHLATRNTMEFLLHCLAIEYAREHGLRTPTLAHIADVFRQKATIVIAHQH